MKLALLRTLAHAESLLMRSFLPGQADQSTLEELVPTTKLDDDEDRRVLVRFIAPHERGEDLGERGKGKKGRVGQF